MRMETVKIGTVTIPWASLPPSSVPLRSRCASAVRLFRNAFPSRTCNNNKMNVQNLIRVKVWILRQKGWPKCSLMARTSSRQKNSLSNGEDDHSPAGSKTRALRKSIPNRRWPVQIRCVLIWRKQFSNHWIDLYKRYVKQIMDSHQRQPWRRKKTILSRFRSRQKLFGAW